MANILHIGSNLGKIHLINKQSQKDCKTERKYMNLIKIGHQKLIVEVSKRDKVTWLISFT
jgi:hypothetical protein